MRHNPFYMRLGYVQTKPSFSKVERNVDNALLLASSIDAKLIVLPELFNTGYLFRNRGEVAEYAEDPIDGYTANRLAEFTKKKGNITVAGIVEKSDRKLYNSALLVKQGKLIYIYRKTHLFYKEKELFDPGDTGFKVIDLGDFKVGVLICFDWLFPEAARTLTLMGADVIAHPSNLVLPGLGQLGMRVRSIENRVFTVTANRVGAERRGNEVLRFTGRSQVVDPMSRVILKSGSREVVARSINVDLSLARDKKITSLNDVITDRRTKYYFS